MNKPVTSQDEIIRISKQIVLEKGFTSFSMRAVAAACGVAVGSIYNYFPSKGALLSTTVESIWKDFFRPFDAAATFDNFIDCVECLFSTLEDGEQKYPGFFTVHSLHFSGSEKATGKARMQHLFASMEQQMVAVLENDEAVRPGVFDGALSREAFVDYILTLAISTQLKKQRNAQSLLAMIRNCIY